MPTIRLAAHPNSVRAARHFVARALAGDRFDGVIEAAELMTSEVVTNALLHGAVLGREPSGELVLRVDTTDGAVRIEVHDNSPRPPRVMPRDEARLSGRGMRFVDSLASDWGTMPNGSGKWVWFSIRV